jgi:hypothetical protein
LPVEFLTAKATQAFLKATGLRAGVSATLGALTVVVALWYGRPPSETYVWFPLGVLLSAGPLSFYFAVEREYGRKLARLKRLHAKKLLTDAQFAQAKNIVFQWLNSTLAGDKTVRGSRAQLPAPSDQKSR